MDLTLFPALGLAILLVAAWLAWHSAFSVVAGLWSSSWPVARGRLVSAAIVKKRDADDNEVWRPVWKYSYSVNGTPHANARIRFGVPNALLWFAPSHPIVCQAHHGQQLTIRYCPRWPAISTVQAGMHPFVMLTAATAGGLGWLGYAVSFAR